VTFSDPKEAFLFIFTRVARWYIFRPIISIWVNFGVIAMKDVGKFYGHLVYFVVILVYIVPILMFYTKKNLATLIFTAPGINICIYLRYDSTYCYFMQIRS
jgi:hypothetical protein